MTIAKAVARAWSDPDYKTRLMNDTKAALAEVGVEIPDGVSIKVVENDADTQYMVLPRPPSDAGELPTEELEAVAGGMCNYSIPASGWG